MSAASADVLIVGAGAYGLSTAWWMTQRRPDARILVVDGGEFASGGTGRNLAGFRMQWGLEFNIRLSQESIAIFEEAEARLDYPGGIGLRQHGYLLIAHSDKMLQGLKDVLPIHREFGVPSEILSPEDCLRVAPMLNPEGVVGGSFCHKDGTASPFLWLDALLRAVRRGGAEVRYRTAVERIERQGGGYLAHTADGPIPCAKVLVCTDWQAPELLRPLGVELPISGLHKEALVTEPWAPVVGPLLVSYKHGLAVNQMTRGTILAYATQERPAAEGLVSTPDYLRFCAEKTVDLVPGLAGVNVLRTWAGMVSQTPDMQAVLGETEAEGVYVAVSAYKGFLTSPAVGRVMAELVLDGHSNDPVLAPLSPRRFETGDLVPEPLTV
jgi:sarcosine oxidase subunit beta